MCDWPPRKPGGVGIDSHYRRQAAVTCGNDRTAEDMSVSADGQARLAWPVTVCPRPACPAPARTLPEGICDPPGLVYISGYARHSTPEKA